MYLPFHFESHKKKIHIFSGYQGLFANIVKWIEAGCKTVCELSGLLGVHGVESSGGTAQTETQNYSDFLPRRRFGKFFFHPIYSTHSVTLNLHLKIPVVGQFLSGVN